MTIPALTASPQIEAAVKAFQTVGIDADRLKTYCELVKIEEQIAKKTDGERDPILLQDAVLKSLRGGPGNRP
jgi:hypothetical protein